MAIWRQPDLETLLGGPLDAEGLTQETIERLVDEAARESEVLDFKGALDPPTKGPRTAWLSEQEFAKDVAAFANHRGGLLLVGIEDADGVATKAPGWALSSTTEVEERRLRQALVNYLSPITYCDFIWVERSPSGRFLGVVIPPSPRSPHAVMSQTGEGRTALRYPVRHGAGTDWLGESEVAARYRRRLDAQGAEASRLELVIANGIASLDHADGVWLFVAVVPEAPVPGRLDARAVDRIDKWHRSNGVLSPLGRSIPAHGRGIAAPGRVVFTGSRLSSGDDETEVRDALVELYVDGGAFAATPTADRTTEDDDGRQVGEITLVDDGFLLVDEALTWCASEAGAWGTARVVMGFMEAGSSDGSLGAPIELVQSDAGTVRRVRPSRRLASQVRAEAVADLSATLAVQQRLAVLHQLLAGILQWFGLAEPAQVRPDGSLVTRQFTMARHQEVSSWAQEHGVEAERLGGT